MSYLQPEIALPSPPVAPRQRTQLEALLVLRRNTLELWGAAAYEQDLLSGRFLGRDQLMVNAPDGIRHVLVTNNENYARHTATHRLLQPLLGNGLFLAEGDAWRHQRRTIAPAMAPRMMPILAAHVAAATEETVAALAKAHGLVELLPHLQTLALRIAAQSMFSLEAATFAGAMRKKLLEYGWRFARPGVLDLVLPRTLSSPMDLRRAAFRREWLALIDQIIDERARSVSEIAQPRDLFDMLASARDPQTGRGFSRAQLRDEVSTMIIAGHETTSVTLFWACYVAARLPALQNKLAQEVADLDLSATQAAAALRDLVWTRAFIDEVLRLYPPAFLLSRIARADDEICGRRVVAGTVINISPWVLHRHVNRWTKPDVFDPARFLPDAPPPERYAYLPFGAGPRVCVGAQFALTEAVLVLARLLQRFQLDLVGRQTMVPRGIVTTQPDRTVRFILSPRKSGRASETPQTRH
jgi:unspecific monooxygenase